MKTVHTSLVYSLSGFEPMSPGLKAATLPIELHSNDHQWFLIALIHQQLLNSNIQHWPVHYIPRLIKQVHVWGLKCILTAVKMSYCKEFDKDQVIFLTEEDAAQQSSIELPESGPGEASQGLISESGEVNWFCPCLVRCLWINDVCSVTRFGEISPLWPEFKVFVKFLTDYFLFCKMLRLLWQICDIFG